MIYDRHGTELVEYGSNNSKAQKKCTDKWVLHKISFNSNDFKSKDAASIVIFEAGKDVEYWAGHFGTRFAQEKLIFKFGSSSSNYENTNNIKHILGTKYIPSNLPLFTNFNKSMGNKYFINGRVQKSNIKYYNLNDCDLNLSYSNFNVELPPSVEEIKELTH